MSNKCPFYGVVKSKITLLSHQQIFIDIRDIVPICKSLHDLLLYRSVTDEICHGNNVLFFVANQSAIKSVLNENICARLMYILSTLEK